MRDLSLLVIVIALLAQQLGTLWGRYDQRSQLQTRLAAQVSLIEDTHAVKDQLRSVLLETRVLASRGNDNAARLISALEQQGVRFRDAKTP